MESSYQIESALHLCHSKFSFDREKGYDLLLSTIKTKPQITHILDEKVNIINGICSCLLLSSNLVSPVSSTELIKELLIIELACISNPLLACSFSFCQGIPLLLKMIQSDDQAVQLQVLDTLQSVLLYSPNCKILTTLNGIVILSNLLSNSSLRPKLNETLMLISKINKKEIPNLERGTVYDTL